MYCENCGAKHNEGDSFCWCCGLRISHVDESLIEEKGAETELPHILLSDAATGLDEEFEFLDRITYQQRDYIFLLPVGSTEEGAVTVLEVKNPGTSRESFESVNDEALLDLVFRIFQANNVHRFNFSDD